MQKIVGKGQQQPKLADFDGLVALFHSIFQRWFMQTSHPPSNNDELVRQREDDKRWCCWTVAVAAAVSRCKTLSLTPPAHSRARAVTLWKLRR